MSRARQWEVNVDGNSMCVSAKTAGSAFRKAVKIFITEEVLKRQPKSTLEGGWKDTTVELV